MKEKDLFPEEIILIEKFRAEKKESSSQLEEKYKEACLQAEKEIGKQLVIASLAIKEAEVISEKYGVPFDSNVTPLRMSYLPDSFSEKWGEIEELIRDKKFLPEYSGWEHSAIC